MKYQLAKVEYQVGTYHGFTYETCHENEDDETITARVKSKIFRTSGQFYGIVMCAESFRVIERR